ncbi:MAG: hypothetical protein JWP87_3659 [Labilithrix sp.]|nr:hypothetical protein [Labilithrix sp.]
MRRFGLIALAAFGVAACGSDEPAAAPLPAAPPGSIIGQALLFDGLNHANTTVTMTAASRSTDTTTSLIFRTTTDPGGAFEFKNVPPGTYVTTYKHETYVDVSQPNVVVSDSTNGQRSLDRAILTRAAYVVDGQTVLPGNRAPKADRQLFLIDGQLGLYSQDTGVFGRFPRTLSVVGGTMTPDAKNALLLSGTSASLGTTDALYAAKIDRIDGSPFEAPALISTNAVQAGVSPNSSRAFVFTSNGNPGNVDLWTFAFADTKTVTKVAGDVTYSSIVYAADPAYPTQTLGGTIPYATPVYGHLGYLDNPHLVSAVSVSDFNVFDVNAGSVSKFANVVSRTSLPIPTGSAPGTPAMQLIMAVPDAAGAQRDVYLWNPGVALPTKLNTAALPAGSVVDTSSSPGRAFLVTPNTSGATDISVFDISATPNLRPVVNNLLWSPGSSIASYFTAHGRVLGPNKYYVLGRNGTNANLVSVDLTTLTSSVVQGNITKVGGGTFSSFDDLTASSPTVFRTLSPKTFALNIASNGTQLTPVIVDGGVARQVTGLFASSAFTSLTVNDAGTALAFLDTPMIARHATISTSGVLTPNSIALTAATEAIALSPNGQRLAYSASGAIRTTDATGADEIAVGTAPSTVTKLAYLDPGVVAATSAGSVYVGHSLTAASLTAAIPSGAFNPTFFGFADGTRVLLHNGSSTLYEVAIAAAPSVAGTYPNTGPSFVTMNGPRTQAAIIGSTFSTGPLTVLASNGTRDTPSGSWAALPGFATSPNGTKMYFRDTSGRVLAFDAATASTQVASAMTATSSSFLRPFHDGADFLFVETAGSGRDLVLVNADTATRTVVMKGMLGTAIANSATSALDPWVSADGSTIFAAGTVPGAAGAPASTRLVAYTTSLIPLGDNVASTPFPALDVTSKNLLFQTNKESLLGTGTLASFPLGGTAPVILADKVRSYAFSPDTKSLAALVVKDGAIVLQSGPVGKPATTMGPVGFTKLVSGTNLVFSDDGTRLFALDSASTGALPTSGILWSGAVGGNTLSGVTTDVLAVFPDHTGKQAGVLTKKLDASGAILNRFAAQ